VVALRPVKAQRRRRLVRAHGLQEHVVILNDRIPLPVERAAAGRFFGGSRRSAASAPASAPTLRPSAILRPWRAGLLAASEREPAASLLREGLVFQAVHRV